MPRRTTTSPSAMVALLVFISIRLRDSRIGRAWMAIREDEIAAGAMGVDRTKFKLLAFAIGAAFGGMTGVFYVAKLQTATPEMFGFPVSVMILVMIVFGGIGSVWGVVLGAFILQLAAILVAAGPDRNGCNALGRLVDSGWLQQVDLVPSIELIFGLILVVMMLFRREGLIPATRQQAALTLRSAARRNPARRLHRSEAARPGRRRAHRRGGAGDPGRDRALRRADRAERGGHRGAERRRGGGDRAERLRQVHAVQRHHRAGAGGGRLDPLPRRGDHGPAAARDPGKGHRAHVPEPAAVSQPDGDGERADRPARAADHRRVRRRSFARPARAPKRWRRATGRWRSSRSSATG